MRPFRLILSALALLVAVSSCDSGSDEPFSLTVAVTDAQGRPVAGREVALVYGAGPQGIGTGEAAQGKADAFLSVPSPNPWNARTDVRLGLKTDARVRIDLVDLEGRVVQTAHDGPLTQGQYAFVFSRETSEGGRLPGGVYAVRATVDADTLRQWTIHSEVFVEERAAGYGRVLGVTGADGTLTVSDRTVAPALYGLPPVELSDEFGNSLGTYTVPRSADVFVETDEQPARQAVTFRDGPNRVDLRLP